MIVIRPAPEDGNGLPLPAAAEGPAAFGLRPDPGTGSAQWFHIRAEGPAGDILLAGADASSYPAGWRHQGVAMRPRGGRWRRIPMRPSAAGPCFRHAGGRADYALTVPHTAADLERLLRALAAAGVAEVGSLGRSPQGRDISRVAVGTGALPVWVLARQHGGEPPAGWCAEGLLRRLANRSDPAAAALRARARVFVVPLANPDGARLGNLRANAAGVDPNRSWACPGACAEVETLRAAMLGRRPALVLDLHTDFELPYPYLDPADGPPPGRAARIAARARFEAALADATPDFQSERRYPYAAPPDPAAQAHQCAGWVAAELGAAALTLELPSGDHDLRPDPAQGWSPARSMALGAALVPAILAALG